jgi:hypothetical protein
LTAVPVRGIMALTLQASLLHRLVHTCCNKRSPGLRCFSFAKSGHAAHAAHATGIVVEATVKLIEVPIVTVGHIYYRGLDTAVSLLDR